MNHERRSGWTWRLGLACLSASLMTGGLMAAPVTLVRDGEPQAAIVIAARATAAAQLGAYELQHHVRRITGATLPIVADDHLAEGTRVLVGDSAAVQALGIRAADLSSQEYAIRFLPDTVALLGRDKPDFRAVNYESGRGFPGKSDAQATCYAVYDFLERFCGVRWYAPTEAGTVLPTNATLVVEGADIRRKPAFRYRDGLGGYHFQQHHWFTPYKELWFDPGLYTGRELELFRLRLRMGGEAFAVNHSFYGYMNDSVIKEGHPDWFARGGHGMCFSSTGLLARVVADARAALDTGRGNLLNARQVGKMYVSLVPPDHPVACDCPECARTASLAPTALEKLYVEDELPSAGNIFFGFVNRVARALRTSHPDAFVSTLSYWNYLFPPTREPLESNVAVTVCLRVRNWWVPYIERRDLAIYNAWIEEARVSGRPIYVWLYYTFPQEVMGSRMFPGFFARTAAKQLKRFAKDGVAGAFLNGLGEQVDTYVTFKLLDDPSLDVEALLAEFFTLYYGQAGQPLRQMYDEMEQVYSDPAGYPESIRQASHRKTHQTEELAWGSLGTPERMARWKDLMDRAEALAAPALERKRVAAWKQGIWEPMTVAATNYQMRVAYEPFRAALHGRGLRGDPAGFPVLRVPKVPAAGGDPETVAWERAAPLVHRAPNLPESFGDWPTVDGYPTRRGVRGLAAHDGAYLYLKLSEAGLAATTLAISDDIENDDTWELYVSKARGREKPFCRLWINGAGHMRSKAYFEASEEWDSQAKVTSTMAEGHWTVTLALPLDRLVEGGARPGEVIYFNAVRAGGGESPDGMPATLAWSPTFRQNPRRRLIRQVHFMPWHVWDTREIGEMELEP